MTNAAAIRFASAVWDALSTGIQDAEGIDKAALRDAGNRFYFSENSAEFPLLCKVYFATLEYVNGDLLSFLKPDDGNGPPADNPLDGLARASQNYEQARADTIT